MYDMWFYRKLNSNQNKIIPISQYNIIIIKLILTKYLCEILQNMILDTMEYCNLYIDIEFVSSSFFFVHILQFLKYAFLLYCGGSGIFS